MTEVEVYIYHVLKRFVSRQLLVLEVLTNLRPDIVAYENSSDIVIEELLPMLEQYKHAAFSGTWKDWDYYIHGRGCRLTHRGTDEPIEWDLPDLEVFDKHWFVNYLNWYAQRGSSFQNLTREQVFATLESLADKGLIERKSTVQYRLRSYG